MNNSNNQSKKLKFFISFHYPNETRPQSFGNKALLLVSYTQIPWVLNLRTYPQSQLWEKDMPFNLELIGPNRTFMGWTRQIILVLFFLIDELGLELMTSPSTFLLQREEVPYELWVIGQIILVI